MDIAQALSFIMNRTNQNNGFNHFHDLLVSIDNPQDKLPIIHIAGTNGKGSTVQFLSNILIDAGYKTGTFVSPHLETHQDRIQINHQNITDDFIVNWMNQKVDWISQHKLNMFEIDYLMMVDYFLENKVDIAIVETGLGGRLDATNVVHYPLCSVITTIGLDHQERLGNTLEAIAYEKAGIIKHGSAVIVGKLSDEVKVIEKIADERKSAFIKTQCIEKIKVHHFIYKAEKYQIASPALYQMDNAAVTIEVVDYLTHHKGYSISRENIDRGLNGPIWRGRFEKIGDHLYLDGAHNIAGIKALIENFDTLEKPIYCVCSVLKDKDYKEMFDLLEVHCEQLYITTFDFYRAMKPEDLMAIEQGIKVVDYQMLIKSLIDKQKGTIIVCGSLYFISEVRAFFVYLLEKVSAYVV
ncbi:MAG: folylpolyglutamate synthase/dihydrofolate synthase family protein [Erysipelotrichaceae bacterium]